MRPRTEAGTRARVFLATFAFAVLLGMADLPRPEARVVSASSGGTGAFALSASAAEKHVKRAHAYFAAMGCDGPLLQGSARVIDPSEPPWGCKNGNIPPESPCDVKPNPGFLASPLQPSPDPLFLALTGKMPFAGADGEPAIDLGYGTVHFREKDAGVTTVGPEISFSRTYISRGTTHPGGGFDAYHNPFRPLGQNWWHSYEVRMEKIHPGWDADGVNRNIIGPDVSASFFSPTDDNADPLNPTKWIGSDGGWMSTIEKVGDKEVRFFFDGSFQEFASPLTYEEPGKLLRTCDAKSFCQVLTYNPDGRLFQVRDERSGRALTFEYQQDAIAKHLTRVSGPGGEVRFEYDVGWGVDDQPGCSGPEDEPCNDARLSRVIREDRIEQLHYDLRSYGEPIFNEAFVLYLTSVEYCENNGGTPANCKEVSRLEYDPYYGVVTGLHPARGPGGGASGRAVLDRIPPRRHLHRLRRRLGEDQESDRSPRKHGHLHGPQQ